MRTYTIMVDDDNHRVRIVPRQTADSRWTYRVEELDGTQLDDEPLFTSESPADFERDIQSLYSSDVWDLRPE